MVSGLSAWTGPQIIVLGFGTGLLFCVAIAYLVVLIGFGPTNPRVRAECDEAVESLLHSKDLVEVTRAGIIIDRLNCSIWRRL